MKRFIQVVPLLLILTLCFLMIGCSASAPSDNYAPEAEENGADSSIVNTEVNRKIIYTVTMRITADDVAAAKQTITSKSSALGGYVESNNESYDDGKCERVYVTYRIPTEKLDEFISSIEGNGSIESKNVSTTDITTSYVDAEAKKNALLERKQLLEEMAEEDGISTSDKLSIINEISEVNTELEEINLLIKGYDSKINYSTVTLTINQAPSFLDTFIPLFIFLILPAMIGLFFIIRGIILRKKKSKINNV